MVKNCMQIRWCIWKVFGTLESIYITYIHSEMGRLKKHNDTHTFIKYINGNSNLKCPKWFNDCVCDAMQCIAKQSNSMQYSDKRFKHLVHFCTMYGCSVFTQCLHSLQSQLNGISIKQQSFLYLYSEHFHSLPVFVCMNCANLTIYHPFRLNSFFVQNPTQLNSNEKTFNTNNRN